MWCFSVQVLGADQIIPDATQTPARLLLPAPCASETCPSVHPRPNNLLGSSLDPQVHLPRHHLPSDGECVILYPGHLFCSCLRYSSRGHHGLTGRCYSGCMKYKIVGMNSVQMIPVFFSKHKSEFNSLLLLHCKGVQRIWDRAEYCNCDDWQWPCYQTNKWLQISTSVQSVWIICHHWLFFQQFDKILEKSRKSRQTIFLHLKTLKAKMENCCFANCKECSTNPNSTEPQTIITVKSEQTQSSLAIPVTESYNVAMALKNTMLKHKTVHKINP